MDAGVVEPIGPTIKYMGRSTEERVSALEGTIANQNRIFDMLHEGQQNLRDDIAKTNTRIDGMRDDMGKRFGEMRDDMGKRFGEMRDDMDNRFGEVNAHINETNERIATMELGINERIAALDVRVNERIATMELGINERIAALDVRLNTKIDSNLKWILGVQIAAWITIIAAILL